MITSDILCNGVTDQGHKDFTFSYESAASASKYNASMLARALEPYVNGSNTGRYDLPMHYGPEDNIHHQPWALTDTHAEDVQRIHDIGLEVFHEKPRCFAHKLSTGI